jgi:hypothetical protein
MPSYVLGAGATTRAQRDALAELTVTRHPEVLVDVRYAAHDDNGLDFWICRAPSDTHIRRWASAGHLDVQLLHPVDLDDAAHPHRTASPATSTEPDTFATHDWSSA